MKILKTYVIPETIKIELIGEHWLNALGPIVRWRVCWQFWRQVNVPAERDGRWGLVYTWGSNSSSIDYHNQLEAEQAFDIAVARVNSWIVMNGDISVDIMHDHDESLTTKDLTATRRL
jgi:hypothetical protein